jgi:hypothetical protein
MSHQKDFLDETYKLATSVAKKAQEEGTKFDEMLDALKALAPYYAPLMKGKKDSSDDESEAPSGTFSSWRDRLSVVEGGADGGETGDVQAGTG